MERRAPKGVDVRTVVDLLAFDGLRADVLHCADGHSGGGEGSRLTRGFGDAEVRELHRFEYGAILGMVDADQDVGGFDVAVGDALLAPRVVERDPGPGDEVDGEARLKWTVRLEQLGGIRAVDVLHRDPESSLELAAVVQRDDVRVRELRE